MSNLTVRDTLEKLYNSAWVEGSNYKDNNPEGSPIPSWHEIKCTDYVLKQLAILFDEKIAVIIGENEAAGENIYKDQQGVEYYLLMERRKAYRNELCDEQRKRAEAIRKELWG